MKKSYFLLVVFAFLGWSVKTQTFLHDAIPEAIFPDGYSGKVKKTSHVSCASTKTNLKAYSWCSDDPGSPGGITLLGANNTRSFFPMPGVQDLEVAFCDDIVIASYYIPGEGVFINTYSYSVLSGAFSLLEQKRPMSSTGKKPRIAGSGQNLFSLSGAAAVVWEESNHIMVAAIEKPLIPNWGGPLTHKGGQPVEKTHNGKIPDISIEIDEDGERIIYISYFDPTTSKIKVIKQDFFILLYLVSFMISFDDIDEYIAPHPVSYIDICQPYGSDGWAYAFVMNNGIHVRGYSSDYPSVPSTFSITDYPYFNTIEQRKPSIAFSFNEDTFKYDRVLVAWSMKGWLQFEGMFYVNKKIDGSPVTPNSTFHAVATNWVHDVLYGQVAVSKATTRNSEKFMAYSITNIDGGLEMRYKTFPGAYSHSRGVGETAAVEQLSVSSLAVYPNPFSDYFQLEAEDYKQGQQLDLQLIDFAGKIVFSTKGDVAAVNTQLKTACPDLNAGVYIVKVNGNEQHTFKIVKQ